MALDGWDTCKERAGSDENVPTPPPAMTGKDGNSCNSEPLREAEGKPCREEGENVSWIYGAWIAPTGNIFLHCNQE